MDLEGVREALLKRPFESFNIRLADGRSLAVRHPEMVAVGKRRIIVVEPDDSWLVIEPLLIVSLDYNGERSARTDHREKEDT
jgi:virulence-associated protein VagC